MLFRSRLAPSVTQPTRSPKREREVRDRHVRRDDRDRHGAAFPAVTPLPAVFPRTPPRPPRRGEGRSATLPLHGTPGPLASAPSPLPVKKRRVRRRRSARPPVSQQPTHAWDRQLVELSSRFRRRRARRRSVDRRLFSPAASSVATNKPPQHGDRSGGFLRTEGGEAER